MPCIRPCSTLSALAWLLKIFIRYAAVLCSSAIIKSGRNPRFTALIWSYFILKKLLLSAKVSSMIMHDVYGQELKQGRKPKVACFMIDGLTDWLTAWKTDRLTGFWLTDWLTLDWFTDWHLTDWHLTDWLTFDWLTDTYLMTLNWLTDWNFTDWLTDTWLTDWYLTD